jgi:hypothetical protein
MNKIDLNAFSEAELRFLNRVIVERLNDLSRARRKLQLMAFKVGDTVEFEAAGEFVEGTIVRLNQKTATIETSEGRGWRVSPQLLRKIVDVTEYHEKAQANLFLPTMDTVDVR